jgi:hypothetical protein
MKNINVAYLKNILTERKELLRREVQKMVVDNLTPLSTIRERSAEMQIIDDQLNELEKA